MCLTTALWKMPRRSCGRLSIARMCGLTTRLVPRNSLSRVQTKCKHAPRHSTTRANRAKAESPVIEPNHRTQRHPTTPPKWAHNPKVAGSNPAPAMLRSPAQAGFFRGRMGGSRYSIVPMSFQFVLELATLGRLCDGRRVHPAATRRAGRWLGAAHMRKSADTAVPPDHHSLPWHTRRCTVSPTTADERNP
jgi:hypothetical protein